MFNQLMKKLGVGTCAVLLSFLFVITAFAKEDGISSIHIDASLQRDGSCDITETWVIDNVYEGTEYYKALHNLENMSVTNLRVSDDTGRTYEVLGYWDTSRSFAKKAYTCGILKTDKGYELCWGISELGDRTYTFSYSLNGLVKRYSDNDGFYHQFVSGELSSSPQAVVIDVSMEDVSFTADNASIWAMGYKGDVQFNGGSIVLRSNKKLGSNDYVNLLAGFDAGLFDATPSDKSFEDVKDRALNHGKYVMLDLLKVLGGILGVSIVVGLLVYFVTKNIRLADGSKLRRVGRGKAVPTSIVPFGNSIPAAVAATTYDYALGVQLDAIAAYLVRWQLDHILQFESDEQGDKQPKNPTIRLLAEPSEEMVEVPLFRLLQMAANDNVLTLKAWKTWAQKNYSQIEAWKKRVKGAGDAQLLKSGFIAADAKSKLRFTSSGYDMFVKMLGFYNHLASFSNSDSHIEAPKMYWNDYLVYAALFQITKNVTGGLQSSYGDEFDDYCGEYHMNSVMFMYFMHSSNDYSRSAAPAASEGGGGSSMSGGGGGFSGGGGGGSR